MNVRHCASLLSAFTHTTLLSTLAVLSILLVQVEALVKFLPLNSLSHSLQPCTEPPVMAQTSEGAPDGLCLPLLTSTPKPQGYCLPFMKINNAILSVHSKEGMGPGIERRAEI